MEEVGSLVRVTVSQQRELMEGILWVWKSRIMDGTVYQQLELIEGCIVWLLLFRGCWCGLMDAYAAGSIGKYSRISGWVSASKSLSISICAIFPDPGNSVDLLRSCGYFKEEQG